MTFSRGINLLAYAVALAAPLSCGGGGGAGGDESAAPVAKAVAPAEAVVGSVVTLDGSKSTGGSGGTLNYFWTMVSVPEGSVAALSAADVAGPTFTPDKEGAYKIQLEVDDGKATSRPSTVAVAAFLASRPLAYGVLDAEYSRTLDRIVAVSAEPPQLHVIDPLHGTETAVTLAMTPTCVSVHPGAAYAAVGHSGKVSYVNLSSGAVEKVLDAGVPVYDVVLAANGYVYAFPGEGADGNLVGIKIETAGIAKSGFVPWENANGKLHPNGSWIYATNLQHSETLEKYDISGGAPVWLYETFGRFDYHAWGGHWYTAEGSKIILKAAQVVNAAADKDADMSPAGAIENLKTVVYAAHSMASNKIVVVPGGEFPKSDLTTEDTVLNVYHGQYFSFEKTVRIPDARDSTGVAAVHGAFLFFDADGTKLYVVSHAQATSSFSGRSAVAVLEGL